MQNFVRLSGSKRKIKAGAALELGVFVLSVNKSFFLLLGTHCVPDTAVSSGKIQEIKQTKPPPLRELNFYHK